MKKILLVAATELEIRPFLAKIKDKFQTLGTNLYQNAFISLQILYTGVGAVATCYQLTKTLLQQRFDMVINAGIAGTSDYNSELGQVFNVIEDSFGDLGATDKEGNFVDIFSLGFANPDAFPFNGGKIYSKYDIFFQDINQIAACTYNTATGSPQEVENFIKKYPNQLQTMEGAAFFYVCALENVPVYAQIRAVSNYVEPRDKSRWKIGLALENLALYLEKCLLEIAIIE